MCAAANYAVCFGVQDPAQSLCVSFHKGCIFLADQTLYLCYYDASNTLGSDVSDR